MSKKKKFLIPDGLHIHSRNFKSLIDFLNLQENDAIFIKEYDHLKSVYGNYNSHKALLLEEYDFLSSLDYDALYNYCFHGINVYIIAQAELLSFLLIKKNWHNDSVNNKTKSIFGKAFNENKEELLLNMSSALFWLKFWKKEIKKCLGFEYSLIFSGSLIYAKSLISLLQATPIRSFILEHFFTGNEYYLEEKSTHIANNSDIKFRNIYNNYLLKYKDLNEIDKAKERVKAINKIKNSQNKNVKQPLDFDKNFIKFSKETNIVTILGQVINDFSIIESNMDDICSLMIYSQLIDELLEKTDFNIVFKAHPWENQKANIKGALTKEYIIARYSNNHDRVKVVDNYNLNYLISESDYIVSICSQSLLEAAYMGKKCFQIGNAFFGDYGFTYDFKIINKLVAFLKTEPEKNLNLEEYSKYLEYITIICQYHLVSVHPSGLPLLRMAFKKEGMINLEQKRTFNDLSETKKHLHDTVDNIEHAIIECESGYEKKGNLRRRVINATIKILSSEKSYQNFQSNPVKFFTNSRKKTTKFLGRFY